jgi:hypothetical protein
LGNWPQNAYPDSCYPDTKAISVKAHTALRVFSLAFFVAAPVTVPGDAPGDAPRRRTNILRNSVRAVPAIA